MGVNTKIKLPLHVSTDRIAMFVARVAGHPIVQESFPDQTTHRVNGRWEVTKTPREFDPSQPCCQENQWHVEFVGGYDARPQIKPSEGNGLSFGTLVFLDANDNSHFWYIHAETENEDFRELGPGCHGLAVAVGRRLVKFFGGEMLDSDAVETRPFDLRVPNARATFPKKLRHQSSNDRWYQFHNALFNEPVLSAHELESTIAKFGGNEDHLALVEALRAQERKAALEQVAQEAVPIEILTQRANENVVAKRKPRKI